MKLFMFLLLASYTVKCEDTSYYVIQMPEKNPPTKLHKKPFRVYWNVPTMQCRSKKIPFENLHDKFGILQNKNDSFRGEKIAILYDPGLFPALLKNETSGRFIFRNGGVPQQGDIEKHLASFRSVLEQSIPDPNFSGVGIIDFESWRPVFRQNFGILVPYKDVSYEIEKKLHWWWPKAWIQAEAKQRFEQAARAFMQSTLTLAKQMRPNALWGYYGFPYCFNMANNNPTESCANKVPEENDSVYWLWSKSTALYPSVYSSKDLSTPQLAGLIRGRVKEAARVKRNGIPILPYFWFRYRDGSYLKKEDLDVALQTMYKSNASGFIIWGSSNDVNTVDKCQKLRNYIENVMGPAIAKYTKGDSKIENDILHDYHEELIETSTNNSTTTTTTFNPNFIEIDKDIVTNNLDSVTPDPEFHWDPPENYTQDLEQYVKEELMNNTIYHNTSSEELSESELSAIDIIINILTDDKYNRKNNTETDNAMLSNSENEKGDIEIFTDEPIISTLSYSTTESSSEYDVETTTVIVDLSTNDSIEKPSKNYKKGMPKSKAEKSNEMVEPETSTLINNYYASTINNYSDYESTTLNNILDDEFLYNSTDDTYIYDDFSTTVADTTTQSLLVEIITNKFSDNEKLLSKQKNKDVSEDTVILTTTQDYTVTTESSTNYNDISTTDDITIENIKEELSGTTTEESDDFYANDTVAFSTPTAFVEQMAGSASRDAVFSYLHFISVATYLIILPL
ncbi:uncharacterized protein LOC131849922 [Achroia grisella]|uniref:uncharacterized protein LOC131849922 n=1 Tax=Achroia grisella TaxID=688607 RepID=UPI0027D20C7F|nr:uncharacterized protein LOC131849922 [Achroia grisella]